METSICQAYYYFEAAKKQVAHYRSGLLDESKKVLDGMVYTYRRGESSILDVLIAQRTYNEV
ncbi:MAG: TolC family protein [Parabacteroides sp.]|nr:TolC family protein [Parabacteroides sp.]